MLFNSFSFILGFFPLFLLVLFLLPRDGFVNYKVVWLGAASLLFYSWLGQEYLDLLLVSIGVNFCFGCALSSSCLRGRIRFGGFVLAISVSVNLLCLAFYKYFSFFSYIWENGFELSYATEVVEIPIGISFYTFTPRQLV